MTKHERIIELRKELKKLEDEITNEQRLALLKGKALEVSGIELEHYGKDYFLLFYNGCKIPCFICKLDESKAHDLLTVMHQTLEEHEMSEDELKAMNLMNHFFHINNFKPINLNERHN